VGYEKEGGLDAEVLKKYIFGGHVAEYMEEMEEEDPEKYNSHFAKYIEEDLDADSLEDKYKEVRRVQSRAGGRGWRQQGTAGSGYWVGQ
jgi:large subunit ribosomal protein L5e